MVHKKVFTFEFKELESPLALLGLIVSEEENKSFIILLLGYPGDVL
jgi:hypothetical protein